MKVIKLDRPFNGIDQKLGYYLVVVPGYEFKIGEEVEIQISQSQFMNQHGTIEDALVFNISGITNLVMMMLKDAFGFSEDWIRDYLLKTGSTNFQVLGIRSITYAY